jgi:hypothetical protein
VANGEIIKTKDGSAVEIIQAKPFNVALAVLEEQEDDLELLKKEALKIEVTDAISFTKAGELIAKLKETSNQAEATMDPFRIIVNKAKDFILQRQRRVTNLAELIRGVLTPKMAEWSAKDARERKAEEDRQQKEKKAQLEREAEEKRRADTVAAEELKKRRVSEIREDLRNGKITKRQAEKFLREAGAQEEADKAQAAADAEDLKNKATETAKQTTVKSGVPKVAGVVQRMNRKFKVVNPQKVKLKYLMPDLVAIGQVARNKDLTMEQAMAEVGGIEVTEEPSF